MGRPAGLGRKPDLDGIIPLIERTVAAGPRVRFVTNLSFRRPAVLDALIRHRVLVGVSLDSADAEVLPELRAGASLDLITANLRYLTEGYRHSHGSAGDVYLTVTVQRPALTGLPALVGLAASCGIGEIRLFPVSAPEESPLALGLSSREVSQALDIAVEAAQRAGIRLVAGARLGEMPVKDPQSPACVHPWSYATISWDGLVGFCDHLIGPEGIPYGLGQWQHESFQAIWNGPAWVTLRDELWVNAAKARRVSTNAPGATATAIPTSSTSCFRRSANGSSDLPEARASRFVPAIPVLRPIGDGPDSPGRPDGEIERMHVNVCIPYRAMPACLERTLDHLQASHRALGDVVNILVVEQAEGRRFNLGKWLNVGFHLYRTGAVPGYPTYDGNDAFLFHPADMLARNCSDLRPRPAAHCMGFTDNEPAFYKACWFRNHVFESVNGYSNEFWGWGDEDNEMFERLRLKDRQMPLVPADFIAMDRASPDFLAGPAAHADGHLTAQLKRTGDLMYSGLNTLGYAVLGAELIDGGMRVRVDI